MGVGLGSMGVGLGLGVPAGAKIGVGLVGPFREEAVGGGVACSSLKLDLVASLTRALLSFPAASAEEKAAQPKHDDRYYDVFIIR
jgi:hypothetical protein